jgi:hypothetical protein
MELWVEGKGLKDAGSVTWEGAENVKYGGNEICMKICMCWEGHRVESSRCCENGGDGV